MITFARPNVRMDATNMAKATKLTDAEQVSAYMTQLVHPLKPVVEQLREIIRTAHPDIAERVKWNAPSYHVQGIDFLTFNLRMQDRVHLIFHHIAIVSIQSPMLEGDYKDRRMVYFEDESALEKRGTDLQQIIRQVVALLQQSL